MNKVDIGTIGGGTVWLEDTLTITAGGAYASGDLIGGKITLSNAVRSGVQTGTIKGIVIVDDDEESGAVDLIFFDTNPSGTTFTNDVEFDIADADLENCIGGVSISTYMVFKDNAVASLFTTEIPFRLPEATTSLYAALVSRDTKTYTAATDLSVRVCIVRD